MKGWELYSWPEGDTWAFSLMFGTNRLKTRAEILAPADPARDGVFRTRVTGLPALQAALAQLAPSEHIAWFGPAWLKRRWGEEADLSGFALPPAEQVETIRAQCAKQGLNCVVPGAAPQDEQE